MVSSGPSQHQAGLGPHTSMQGQAHMRAASGAYGSRKDHIPAPAYAALRQDALCPALKTFSSTSYPTSSIRFARVLSAMRSQHNLLAASKDQSSDLTLYRSRIDGSAKVRPHDPTTVRILDSTSGRANG